MRIGAKLLTTYLILVALVAVITGFGLPRWVEGTVMRAEEERLQTQAALMADRLVVRLPKRTTEGPLIDRQLATLFEEILVDETIAIVNPSGVIVRGTRPDVRGKQVEASLCQTATAPAPPRAPLELEGVGPIIAACAPLRSDLPYLNGYSLLLMRDLAFVQSMAQPITRRIAGVVAIGLVVSILIAWWLSREMVKRLQATGAAARALAEGDLTQRAPERGSDEIAEMAGHFNHMAERIETLVQGLRRSEQARKDLLMMAGHDLRTPITSIGGFAEALRDGVVQDEEHRQRYYQIITAEAGRLNRLVDQILDMAKLEAGQLDLQMQAMPVAPWLTEFSAGFKPVADARGVPLALEIAPEAEQTQVCGDRDRLDQVLTNLAANAVRFSPAGVAVTITARVDGEDLVVAVRDQGPGLPAEEAAHVFERFYQGSNQGPNQVGEYKGSGLGLAIVQSLVLAHGGTVGVESQPGEGATFWFRLKRLSLSCKRA